MAKSLVMNVLRALMQQRQTGAEQTPSAADRIPVPQTTAQAVQTNGAAPPVDPLTSYPPVERWMHWTEYDPKAWPQKTLRSYTLVPTVCFNCESACGLLAYVDTSTLKI